jgi:hypothetical protein
MLSIEQDEAVFAAALRVAEEQAREGNDTAEVTRCACAVVAAAKAVHVHLHEQPAIAKVGEESIELLVDAVPIGTWLCAGPKPA